MPTNFLFAFLLKGGILAMVNFKDANAVGKLLDLRKRAMERIEDRLDGMLARKALAEAKRKGEKPIPWETVKKDL